MNFELGEELLLLTFFRSLLEPIYLLKMNKTPLHFKKLPNLMETLLSCKNLPDFVYRSKYVDT